MDEVGLFMERRAMRRGALVLIFGLVSGGCGEVSGHDDTVSSSGSGSSSGSSAPDSSMSGSGSSGGSGTSDASTICQLPPKATASGTCTFCNNEWYCPQPRSPQPQCAPDPVDFGPCTANCILCGSNGYAIIWACNTGSHPPTYATYVTTPFSCQ